MLLVLDKDDCLYVFDSVEAAESDLEAIDIENEEYEFCDDKGQPYIAEVLKSVSAFSGGNFRLVPTRSPDPALPLSFVIRTKHFWGKGTSFKTLEDVRSYFSRARS
jgi:hypothetical protein